MKERLISFTDDMQQASRDGRKGQIRRVVKLIDPRHHRIDIEDGVVKESTRINGCWHVVKVHKCPYGVVGDRLRSDDLLLEITGLRVERLQEITPDDACAEGIELSDYDKGSANSASKYVPMFRDLWDSIYAEKHPWKSNPFVWVIEFKRIDK